MDSDDKFVARRGPQGDDWRWESDAPPGPAEAAPGQTAFDALAATGGWLASRWRAFRDWMNRSYQAPPAPPRDDAPIDIEASRPVAPESTNVPAATVGPPSRAPQAAADTGITPATPTGKPRTLGSVIRWSRIFPREGAAREKEAVPWSRVAGQRPKAALALPRPADVPTDSTSLVMFLAAAGLAAAIVLGVVVAVSALGDDDSGGIVLPVTETPKATLVGPETETPRPTASEEPGATATATPATSRTPRPSPTPRPSATPTPAATRTQAPAPTAAPATAPPPQGAVSLAMWANKSGAWWFGEVSGAQAAYEEGQTVPLLLKWTGNAGQTYAVHLTYDCAVSGAAGAIDYISGIDDWGQPVVFAAHGPAKSQPDAAVLSPDISGFSPDDGNSGVISLYGGSFTVLPGEPSPAGACPGRRTVSLSVRADGGPLSILASGHLALSSAHGSGASRATAALTVLGSVDGVGTASASVGPSAVSDAAH